MTHTERIEQYIREGRTVSGGKGDETAKAGERAQQTFTQNLMNVFSQQFGAQKGVLDFLNAKLTSAVNNPQGFSPEMLAAARSNAINGAATDYQNATRAAQLSSAAHGGSTLPSGVQAQVQGQIAAASNAEKSQNLANIDIANSQQQQQNYWNAVSGLSGIGQAYNPGGFAGLANQGSGQIADLANAYSNSQNTGFFNNLAKGLGGALGNGLGSALSGGIGTGVSNVGSGNYGW